MKILLLFFFSLVFVACSNDATTTTTDSGPNTTNVQNVNGNQPDTSSGITLDSRSHTDTIHKKDSLPR